MEFLSELRDRNAVLFWFGLACLAFAGVCALLALITDVRVFNVSAWIKPFKFSVSIGLFAWTMAWYLRYLPAYDHRAFDWTVVLLFGFEIVYIAWRAGRGELSHFNQENGFSTVMYALMGLAAAVVTAWTGYIGVLFFTGKVVPLEAHYLWAIRAGILLFVVFGFEGFLMGSRLSHTVGGPDGTPGLPLLHWSFTHGDLRAAHFVGMHALQLLPLLAHYLLRSTWAVAVVAVLYAAVAVVVLVLALQGKPVVPRSIVPVLGEARSSSGAR
ncbi:MAG: hypothetical protein KDB96_16745 [Flavobacteriales bacterium]|nr:hypothetical protein [Flavobacteriales bacterium]MCB0787053.1 hypothetical protein [Flavobacteriales bacterium]MCB0810929.1 hypothetical protein [Flavobacteriales bacterium]